MNCDGLFTHMSTFPNKVTILVYDGGLSKEQWQWLETPRTGAINVDIIKFVTADRSNGITIQTYGSTGQDDLSGISNGDLNFVSGDHAFAVISAIALIARKVKVVFIDADMEGNNDGLQFEDSEFWNWISTNVGTYDIDVMSVSMSTDGTSTDSKIGELYNKGVYMITSIGNDGTNQGDVNPQYHAKFYSAGSIDHETRSSGSTKDTYSEYASYGENSKDHAESVDFAMPGNGVPISTQDNNGNFVWKYGKGTSFSTPYLAAAAAVAIYGYNSGYHYASGTYQDPTVSQLKDILIDSSSNPYGTWQYRIGYGVVDLEWAYLKGWNLGHSDGDSGDDSCSSPCFTM